MDAKTERIKSDDRFSGLVRQEGKILFASPTMHGEEEQFVHEAFEAG